MPKVKNGDRWELERYQRRQIARALQACDQSDIILISDVDEIPDKKILYEVIRELSKASLSRSFEESVTYFLHKLSKESTSHIVMDICRKFRHLVLPTKWIYRFRHRHHEYFLNGYVNDNIPGAAVMRFSTLAKVFDMDCNEIRSFWIGGKCRFVKGGWHFSYLGGVDKIINKIQSFSHSEFDTDIYKDKERIEALMEDGSNLYGKTGGGHNITYVEIDETYPKFVLQNRERLKGYIKEF